MPNTPPSTHPLDFHPLTIFGTVAIDLMAYSANSVTPFLGDFVAGAILGSLWAVVAVIVQRFVASDSWGVAVAKGLVVGILTAIPTPLPSLVGGGALGLRGLLRHRHGHKRE